MILRALSELFERLQADHEDDVAPLGRSHQKVTFVVVLELDGTLVGVVDARLLVNGKLQPRRVLVPGGAKPSGSGSNPSFLWDTPEYLLGWSPKDPERAVRRFEAFRQRHLGVEKAIAAPEFSAVCRFLERWDPKDASKLAILEDVQTGYGVFQIRGNPGFVHEVPRVVAWWDEQLAATDPGPAAQCLVTGQIAPIARLHPKIKGVDGAQTTGATIAGFNDPAYWSYGLTQSFNAPTSVTAAHRYVTALNALLDGAKRHKHRLVLGTTTVAFWTERPTFTEDIFLPFVAEGSAVLEAPSAQDEVLRAKLGAFLKALRSGREAYGELEDEPDATAYFILGLAAPTPARIAVRFFHKGTLSDLLTNLRQHHTDIGIERQFREGAKHPEPEFPSIRLLLEQACPRKDGKPDREAIPAYLPGLLLEAVVTGSPYPQGLFAAVMRRLVADRQVNYGKACVIKGWLVRNLGWEVPMSLDTSRLEPAYRLGRLFAALEKTQLDALGQVGTTIRDAFYATASATPATVFPRLLRTYQHHLAKLEGGQKVNREKLVQEILEPLNTIPTHLRLPEQGLFALGYYHQMNAFYTKKREGGVEL